MDTLSVRNISKNYDGAPLLRGLSFEVSGGEIHCLLGRSGSGKSTLLRVVAGLEIPESGQVIWNGSEVTATPPHLRQFGLMFQDYALFPHRNVFENVSFGLEMQHLSKNEINQQVKEALARVNMSSFAKRAVSDLSGGEQQRVALARSLAAKPRLLMLDEPLAALDRSLRLELQQELKSVLHEANIPVIYVTHDQEEAVFLGDKISILHEGKIIQQGTPEQIFAAPASVWVAEFLGMQNFLSGRVVSANPLKVSTKLGEFSLLNPAGIRFTIRDSVTVVIKKDQKFKDSGNDLTNLISGYVLECGFRENGFSIVIDVGTEKPFVFIVSERLEVGEKVTFHIPESSLVIIPE